MISLIKGGLLFWGLPPKGGGASRMVFRSPDKESVSLINSVGLTNKDTPDVPIVPRYANAAKNGNREGGSIRYPFVIADFYCNQDGEFLTWPEMADFIFTELKFRKSEIAGIATRRGKTCTTVKIKTRVKVGVKKSLAFVLNSPVVEKRKFGNA